MAKERILVIQLRQLGDILLTTPCLRALKTNRGEAPEVVFLSHPMGHLILAGNPDVDAHVTYDPEGGWRREWATARQLRARQFTHVFDFMNNPRSAFYTWMTGAPRRYAFDSTRWLAYTQTVPRSIRADYIVRDKFRLLRAAGIEASDERLVLPWTATDAEAYRAFAAATPSLERAALRVVLSPTHRRERRRWPLRSYAEIADRLTQQWGAAVLWLYGPGEAGVVDAAMAMCITQTYKMPATSFRGMAAFLAHMDLFIGNSNGPSHVAVAVDTPSLQLHGHTSAVAWCPRTERHRAIQSPEFGRVGSPRIDRIQVDDVWQELTAMRTVLRP